MTIKDDIASKLEFINNGYVEEKLRTELTGKDATRYVNAPDKIINQQNQEVDNPNYYRFMHDILDYNHFINQILPGGANTTVAVPTIDSTLYNKIYVKKTDTNITTTAFSSITIPTTITQAYVSTEVNRTRWNLENDELIYSEYNFSILLKSLGSADSGNRVLAYGASFGGTNTYLLDILNRLRVAYNILEEDTFASYIIDKKNNRSTLTKPVSMYTLNTSSGKYQTISNINDVEMLVYPLIDISTIDPVKTRLELVRRIFYLYDLLIHIYIPFYLLEKSTGTPYSVIAYDIAYSNARILNARNLVITDVGSSVYKLNTDIQDRINKYTIARNGIEQQAQELTDNKLNLRVESDRLAVSKSYMTKNKNVFIAYLVLFITVIVLSFTILSSSILSDNMKRLSMGILAGISLIAVAVMYTVNRYVLKEYFQNFTTPDLSIASIIQTTDWASERNNLISIILSQVDSYLANSIQIVSLLVTYKGYGDMNFSTKKEQAYYENTNAKLEIEKETIASTNRIMVREGKVSRYRVYYFLELLVTITIASLLSVYLPGATTFATVLASLLILLFTWLYIMNVNNLVRTDGSKLYWGQPDTKQF